MEQRAVERVWARYKRTGAKVLRECLISHYEPLVTRIARRLVSRLPQGVDVEDLRSVGRLGLMEAIESYRPGEGTKFSTYGGRRIWGAMMDELREVDWLPRQARAATRRLSETAEAMRQETGRTPTVEEVGERIGVGGQKLRKLARQAHEERVVSLSGDAGARGASVEERVTDDRAADPAREAAKRQLKEQITTGLSKAERLVVVLYYYEGMTMREIGETLGLCEGRISQMHKSILLRLKARLRPETVAVEVSVGRKVKGRRGAGKPL